MKKNNFEEFYRLEKNVKFLTQMKFTKTKKIFKLLIFLFKNSFFFLSVQFSTILKFCSKF